MVDAYAAVGGQQSPAARGTPVFHFKTQELSLDATSTEATLTGETFDGVQIQGMDTVNIVPPGE